MLLRSVTTFGGFLATLWLSFSLESPLAFGAVAAVALAAGFVGPSWTALVTTPMVGTCAYLIVLGLTGQLGPVPKDSVEGINQVIVNSIVAFLVLSGLAFVGWASGFVYRSWRAV